MHPMKLCSSNRAAVALTLAGLIVLTSGCASLRRSGPAPQGEQTLTVVAACALAVPLDAIGAIFQQRHPGVRYLGTYTGVQQILMQLQHGLRADVFAAASSEDMALARERGSVADARPMAYNRVCVVAWPGAHLTGLRDLARPGLKVVVMSPNAPIGRCTDRCLEGMAADHDFGAEMVKGIRANVKSEETEARDVITHVASGEVDAGFGWLSDARTSGSKVETFDLPQALSPPVEFPIAVLKSSQQTELAQQFVDIALSAEGQAILKQYGFTPAIADKSGV